MTIDFREFTLLAINGLSKKEARRVGKALDVAVAFGAYEHATGNESLRDPVQLRAAMELKMGELRELVRKAEEKADRKIN